MPPFVQTSNVTLVSNGGLEPTVLSGVNETSPSNWYALYTSAVMKAASGENWRNNTEGVLLASAARTAVAASPVQPNHNARGVLLTLNVTANPGGVETLTLYYLPASSLVGPANSSAAFVTQAAVNGTYKLEIYPGVSDTGVNNTPYNKSISQAVPRSWGAQINPSGVGSWTYSLEASLIV